MSKQKILTARDYTARMVERIVPISEISPHEENPRQHPDSQIQQLKASHEQLGQFEPTILWQRPTGYIQVKGHGYIGGVKLTKDEATRAWILPEDTPPEVVKQIMLASNLHAMNSTDDGETLARLLQEQKDLGIDLASLGSDDETLRDMLAKMTPPTLDELTEQYGDEPEDDAFWPVIRVKVSPETKELYDSLMEEAEGTEESIKFAWLLERVNVAEEVEEPAYA